jgi:hydrogenase maturation protease
MNIDAIRAVADAILYEGYVLYPYRPSALKNRSPGWTFGTLLPQQYAALHAGEPDAFRAQVLVVGARSQVSAEVRFLQLCGSEALERSILFGPLALADLVSGVVVKEFAFSQSGDQPACSPVRGAVQISAERVREAVFKLTITVRNQSSPAVVWDTRDLALQQALVSAHALLTVDGGEFVSLLSPPDELAAAAADCKHVGVFPVVVGEENDRTVMLVSPIILYDYPQIAATSHGDFFDSTEIDEMLSLRVLTLTEAEKEEVRASNARARNVLERTEALSAENILKLHGMLRDVPHSGEQ